MIISCPECHKEISDQAIQCPCCGLPSKPTMSNGSTIDQFVVSPVIGKPHSKLEMVATVLSCVVKVTRNAWRPQLWIASFMAIGWAVVSVILIVDLMKGVEDLIPIVKEAGVVSSVYAEKARLEKEHLEKWIKDLDGKIFDERAQRRDKEKEEGEISKNLRDKQAEMVSLANDAHKAGLAGDGPFEPPPKPTFGSVSWVSWQWDDFWGELGRYNDMYNKAVVIIDGYNKGIQSAKAAIATASKRIDDLQGLSRSYQEEPSEMSRRSDIVPEDVSEARQSPWLKTAIFIIHATIIPITLILALSSLLRVIVLAEWLEPMRLVSK